MKREEIQDQYDSLKLAITAWDRDYGAFSDDQVPPTARERLSNLESQFTYYTTLLRFWDHVVRTYADLTQFEQRCEKKYFFRIDELSSWLIEQPKVQTTSRPHLAQLNELLSQTQNARDALSDRYEALIFLEARYESAWCDIQQLWISFNDAKSQDRSIGKLLHVCEIALEVRERSSLIRALKAAFEVEWRHIMQNSVEIRAQADLIREQGRGGDSGLPTAYRQELNGVYARANVEFVETPVVEPLSADDPFYGYDLT